MKSGEWRPNPHSDVPIYEQIGAYIKGKIAYGEWPVGYKLPAERIFAKQLGVNRSTVATAFAELAAEGLIEGRRGRAAREWLASGLYEEHLVQIRQTLRIRRERTIEALNKHMKGIAEWKMPKGGFYIWLHLLPDVSLPRLFDEALRHGILLNLGTIYHSEERRHLRLSYAYAALHSRAA